MPASGGQLTSFRNGWAKVAFGGSRGHHFRRVGASDYAVAACGLEAAVAALYGIGTYPPCRICRKKRGAATDVRTFIDTMDPKLLASSPAAQQIAAAISREDKR